MTFPPTGMESEICGLLSQLWESLPSVALVSTREQEGLSEARLPFLKQIQNAVLTSVVVTLQSFKTVAFDSIEH